MKSLLVSIDAQGIPTYITRKLGETFGKRVGCHVCGSLLTSRVQVVEDSNKDLRWVRINKPHCEGVE